VYVIPDDEGEFLSRVLFAKFGKLILKQNMTFAEIPECGLRSRGLRCLSGFYPVYKFFYAKLKEHMFFVHIFKESMGPKVHVL